jgi:hypothetical protein
MEEPVKRIVCAIALVLGTGCAGDIDDPVAVGEVPVEPAAPSHLGLATMDGGIHVTWVDNADDETEFVIERSEDGGAFAELVRLPFDSYEHHDPDLVPGITYRYRVAAANEAGLSQFTPDAQLTME